MAAARAPIVVGILALAALAGAIGWFVRSRVHTSAERSTALTTGRTGSGRGAIFAPEGPNLGSSGGSNGQDTPALPASPLDAGLLLDAPSHREVFAAQTRDPGWAKKTEADLARRFRAMASGTVTSVECRADQCEVVITGSEPEISAMYDKLEATGGLRDIAVSVLLTKGEERDGKLVAPVYVMFDRSK